MRTTLLYTGVFLTLAATSCKPSLETVEPGKGQADFTRYVAIGNSLTAGFESNGLFERAQLTSYPKLLSESMQTVGGGPFEQPILPGDGSGFLTITRFSTETGTRLPVLGAQPVNLAIVEKTYNPTLVEFKDVANRNILNNLGVPGIRVSDIANPVYGYSNPLGFNPYMEMIVDDAPVGTLPDSNYTYLAKIRQSRPTFFSSWLGNNDVLGYASSGGKGTITDVSTFETLYRRHIKVAMESATRGILATIPNITSAAYFTTAPAKILPLTQAQANQAQAGYTLPQAPAPVSYNEGVRITNVTLAAAGIPPLDTVRFVAGANYPIIYDSTDSRLAGVGYRRQMKDGDLLLLPILQKTALLATGLGTANPISNADVLTAAEGKLVSDATAAYNTIIKNIANEKGLALFDATTYLERIKPGIEFENGVGSGNGAFVTGGLFSLDGVHLTPRGYALVAREMIKSINAKYGSSLPDVDLSKYPGTILPQ
jgi:hypothetical protein